MAENVHEIIASASPEILFDLVADVEHAPQWFPTHLHAEIANTTATGDVVDRYVLDGDGIRSWRVIREQDWEALRIAFQHAVPRPPLTRMRGEWTFAGGMEGTVVRVTHALDVPADQEAVLEKVLLDLDRNVPRQLSQIKLLGETLGSLRKRTVEAVASRSVPLDRAALYARVLDGPTVDETRWRRALISDHKIVFKQVADKDAGVDTLTGEYRLSDRPDGRTDLFLRHTATHADTRDVGAIDQLRKALESAVQTEVDGV